MLAGWPQRRFALKVMREVTRDDLRNAFLARITADIDKNGPTKLVHQRAQLGEAFVNITQAKKGDKAVDCSLRLVLLGKG
ncbi:hypothetical protein DBR42_27145 [Pelomonas sp. HMWF004]|nr:hypothetical protein DBR42_27145 [Pelomonas sp. HMWF004]